MDSKTIDSEFLSKHLKEALKLSGLKLKPLEIIDIPNTISNNDIVYIKKDHEIFNDTPYKYTRKYNEMEQVGNGDEYHVINIDKKSVNKGSVIVWLVICKKGCLVGKVKGIDGRDNLQNLTEDVNKNITKMLSGKP